MVAVSYVGEELWSYFHAPWETRVDLAWQLMEIAEQLTNNDFEFALYLLDVSFDNFAVGPRDGKVIIVDAENVLVADKRLIRQSEYGPAGAPRRRWVSHWGSSAPRTSAVPLGQPGSCCGRRRSAGRTCSPRLGGTPGTRSVLARAGPCSAAHTSCCRVPAPSDRAARCGAGGCRNGRRPCPCAHPLSARPGGRPLRPVHTAVEGWLPRHLGTPPPAPARSGFSTGPRARLPCFPSLGSPASWVPAAAGTPSRPVPT